jgi:hypothetical protein
MEAVNIFLQEVKKATQSDQKATYNYFHEYWASVTKALNITTQPRNITAQADNAAAGVGFCAQMITKDECVLHPNCR